MSLKKVLSCDHPQKVICSNSPQFYEKNSDFGKPGAEPGPGGQTPSQSGQKGGLIPPQPRPRVQQPKKSKFSLKKKNI